DSSGKEIGHFTKSTCNFGLPGNTLFCLHIDSFENIWLGILGNGVTLLMKNQQKYSHYYYKDNCNPNTLPSNQVKCIINDTRAGFYIGTDGGGLSYLNTLNNSIKNFDLDAFGSNKVMCLEKVNHDLWIGMYSGGIARMDVKTGKISKIPLWVNNAEIQHIFDIHYKPPYSLLIASVGNGLVEYNINTKSTKKYEQFNYGDYSYTVNNYLSQIQKIDNNYWVCSMGDGIFVFDSTMKPLDRYVSHLPQKSLPNDIVYCMAQDSLGRIWSGTMNGVAVINNKTGEIVTINTKSGLSSSSIFSISISKNFAWLSTHNSLSRINIHNFEVANFTETDGIISSKLNFNANQIINNQEIAIMGDNGIMFTHPDSIYHSHNSFFFNIAELYVNNVQRPFSSYIELPYNQNNVQFIFPAINYSYSHIITYSCTVTGTSRQQFDLDKKHELFFAGLVPGIYNFTLTAILGNNRLHSKTIHFTLVIHPPFWKTWWFKTLFIICIIFLFLLFYYLRIHAIRSQRDKLQQLVTLRTKDLHNKNHEILLQADRLQENVQKLENVVATKNKLFSIIAHDLKNPIQAINSISQTLLKNNYGHDTKEKLLQTVAENSIALSQLLDNLLYWTLSHTDKIVPQPENCNLAECVNTICNSLQLPLKTKNISLHKDIPTNIYVIADKNLLIIVLRNLISNAVKFTNKNGSIFIRTQYNKINVEILIEDNGIGMPPETVKTILQSQNYSSTYGTAGEKGTGLGIAICKEFIQLINGTLTITSQINKGTTCIISLPYIIQEIENNPSNIPHNSIETISPHVLTSELELDSLYLSYTVIIADDNKILLDEYKNRLSKYFNIHEFSNGIEVLNYVEKHVPDIIITDVHMNEMNGLELNEKLKNNPKTSFIPIIFITSFKDETLKLKSLEQGVSDFLVKPFEIKELVLKIKNLIDETNKNRKKYSIDALNISTPKLSDEEKFLIKTLQIIENNIANSQFSIDDLATMVGYSRSQLYRKIKILTGEGPKEILHSLRMKRASELLVTGKYTIGEVAINCGYEELGHFSRAFKTYFGIAPSEFKQ
ncbi:MAG: response regulator, partial [Bacteroidales bacterium]